METGAIQFGDDWPGLFIRGDNAHSLAHWIRRLAALLASDSNPDVADAMQQIVSYAEIIEEDVIVH